MKESIVTDSTCLIGLEGIHKLSLLPAMFESVVAPPKVQEEFGSEESWLKVEAPTDPALVKALKMMVDDGEAEAIALARGRGWRIILDDRKAREVAKQMGLSVIGTVGLLIQAKRQGIVPALEPLLEALEACGFFLSAELKSEALQLAGE